LLRQAEGRLLVPSLVRLQLTEIATLDHQHFSVFGRVIPERSRSSLGQTPEQFAAWFDGRHGEVSSERGQSRPFLKVLSGAVCRGRRA